MLGESRGLEQAVETMQVGVTITDLDGRIVYVNPADAEMHGHRREELLGRDVRVFAAHSIPRRPLTRDEIGRMSTWVRESLNVRKDGSVFPVQLMSSLVRDPSGEAVGIVTTCEDITRRKEAERVLRRSEERYALAALAANDGLWDWNLESDRVYYSARCSAILGLGIGEGDAPSSLWLDRVHPDDREGLRAAMADHLEARTPRFECEHRVGQDGDTWRWVLVRGTADWSDGPPARRVAGSLTDVTARRSLEAQLTQEALYDSLTGLPNRAFFNDLLRRACSRGRRRKGQTTFAVLFLDLDRFKLINDSLGHAAGDQLLVGVSRRIEKALRPGDVVARFGGDEFCILLDEIHDANDAMRVAARIHDCLTDPIEVEGKPVFTAASVGIAVSDAAHRDPSHLLRNADTAMYRAKSRGRARSEVFDESMHQRAMALLELENELREALATGQFRLVYQPVIDLQTGVVTAFEALVRWTHPERGQMSASSFVHWAEETGIIVPLGWWVLREACSQMSRWARRFPALPDLAVSVNLSAKQLQQPDLVDRIRDALEEGHLEPRRLRLEVNEQVLMAEPDWNADVLNRLRILGVQVQVDDFGTGTSSLSYLNRFRVSSLKIDRSYIRGMETGSDKSAVVQAIITLAQALGIRVIAEGVETPGQNRHLLDLHCDQGQGFHFFHPLETDAVVSLLEVQGPNGNGRNGNAPH